MIKTGLRIIHHPTKTPVKIMKYVMPAILIILCILIGISLQGKVIQIQIEIPPALLPYFEWLISFPGMQQNPETPINEDFPYKTYHI